ncbi:MAG TPA: M56 family metallopeptidase [Myxococcales bacterium]|jgi:beta-lactamase regulating signal transducer with metallopeptidase domain
MSSLPTWGASALLAWIGLPLLLWASRARPDAAPASQARAMTLALLLGAALLFVPLGRSAAIAGAARLVLPPSAGAATVSLNEAAQVLVPPLTAVALAWLLLVLLGLVRLAFATARDLSLSRDEAAPPAAAPAAVERLARELGIAPPRLAVSRRAALPFVLAWPRPTVVLPETIARALDEQALELVLRHELTHLARGDHWTAVVLELLKVPFTLHPAAARLCREIGLAREMAVDTRIGAVAPRAYAHLLVDVAELHRYGPREAGEVALEPHSLERRIQMLTSPSPHRSAPLVPTLVVAALLAVAAALLPAPQVYAADGAADSVVAMNHGQQRILDFDKIARIAVGNPEIADVSPLGNNRVLIFATGRGKTTLLVWTEDGKRHEYLVTVK